MWLLCTLAENCKAIVVLEVPWLRPGGLRHSCHLGATWYGAPPLDSIMVHSIVWEMGRRLNMSACNLNRTTERSARDTLSQH